MTWSIILSSPAALTSFFLWGILHELSHVLVAKYLNGAADIKIVPYPHKKDGRFYWMRASYILNHELNVGWRKAARHLSPWVPRILGMIALQFTGMYWPLVILVGGVLADTWTGSVGLGEYSDLLRAASTIKISPWWIRLFGFTLIITSTIMWFCISILQEE